LCVAPSLLASGRAVKETIFILIKSRIQPISKASMQGFILLELPYRCLTFNAVSWDHVSCVFSRAFAVDDTDAQWGFAVLRTAFDDSYVTHFERLCSQ
jgi:hypothetical protein